MRAIAGTSLAFAACILIAAAAIGQENKTNVNGGTLSINSGAVTISAGNTLSGEQTIRQALQKRSDFDFKEMKLRDVVRFLKEMTKLEIQLDGKALADVGVGTEVPVTFSAHDMKVETALKLLLHPINLTWITEDDVLVITTLEEADNHLVTKVYAVHDLVAPKPSYPFEGMYIPGMSNGGFARVLSSRSSDRGEPVMGMSGGMGGGMSGGMGGMGGMGGGMGGGMFNVPDNLQPANVSGGSGVSSPLTHVLPQVAPGPKKDSGKEPFAPGTPGNAPPAAGMSSGEPITPGSHGAPPKQPRPIMNRASRQSSREPSEATDLTFSMEDLIDTITITVKPQSWDYVGGPGSISPIGGMLIISQTQEVHREVEVLLENLRASNPGLKVVTIRATWLLLNLKQLNELTSSKPGKEGGIDRKALEEMAGKAKGYIGAITCFSGQTVHIASGRSHSAVVGAIPVVGAAGWDGKGAGFEPILSAKNESGSQKWTVNAQTTDNSGLFANPRGVGYQPIMNSPQSGAVLQITPQLLPNTQAILLDLCTSVTRAEISPNPIRFLGGDSPDAPKSSDDKSPARGGQSGMNLDRVNTVVGQLATTLIVPVGEPMLIGGLTREPATDEQEAASTPQLYLFIEATAK